MRFSLINIAFILACALQVCSIQMQWPAVVHVNDEVVLQVSNGVPPYAIGVVQYPKTILTSTSSQTDGSFSWVCDVPQGEQIAFLAIDSLNNTVNSDWIVVQQDLAAVTSMMSVSSLSASIALESSVSVLSASLTAQPTPTETPTPVSQPEKTPIGPIVGGIVGGVAGLLIIALLAYWLMRNPKPQSQPAVLPTVAPGWNPGMDKDTATLASSNLPQSPYYRPTSAAPTQSTGMYSGLPEVQHRY